MARSMTAFARQEEQYSWGQLSCEIRSVNHRYLDPSIRMPDVLRRFEPKLREALRKQLGRGKVEVSIHLKTEQALSETGELNVDMVKSVAELITRVEAHLSNAAPVNSLDVLQWPGILQSKEVSPEALESALDVLFSKTMASLRENREREGAELKLFIEQRLDSIAEQVTKVRARLPELLAQQEEKLRTRLEALSVEVDEERLAQELVYLAQKSDVAEELDRLEAHIVEVKRTLKQKEPIGRRLDFLMQELNREANTLSSKSTASDTSQIAVDLKVLIEQMREQVQNIE